MRREPDDAALPRGTCLRCGLIGHHSTADQCISHLRDLLAEAQVRKGPPRKASVGSAGASFPAASLQLGGRMPQQGKIRHGGQSESVTAVMDTYRGAYFQCKLDGNKVPSARAVRLSLRRLEGDARMVQAPLA